MKISSFGEVLWDDFPEGKVLGGAPLNVLVRLSALGADCAIVSRRGSDEDGEELLRRADRFDLRHGGVSGRTAQQFINAELGN